MAINWNDSKDLDHGALLHAGKIHKVDVPKAILSYVNGVKDHRVMVGSYVPAGRETSVGFVATY